MDNSLTILLYIYTVSNAFNLLISSLLFIKYREILYKNLLILWLASFVSFFLNGISANGSSLIIVMGGSSIFIISLAVSNLVASLMGYASPWLLYAVVYLLGYSGTLLADYLGADFVYLALPVMLSSVFPQIFISIKSFFQWDQLTFIMKCLLITFFLHTLHVMDYPFLRDNADFAPFGFSIALIFLFIESILTPTVIIEKIAEKNLFEVITMKDSFAKFVPKQFLEHLSKESITDIQLGDFTEKNMSVLFADIRSFTSLSESMTPEENFKFLNAYLRRMEPAIRAHNGFIDKFIGDAIMALFADDTDDAVRAAIEMLGNLEDYNAERVVAGYTPVHIGIGINTGHLILGTVGGDYRMDSTVISDSVNLASRLEGMTKVYGSSLLIGEQTFNDLKDPTQFLIRRLGRVKLKGKNNPVTVYEVFDSDAAAVKGKKMEILNLFEDGVREYQKKNISEASHRFNSCMALYPEDRATQVYIERCRQIVSLGINNQNISESGWERISQLDTK